MRGSFAAQQTSLPFSDDFDRDNGSFLIGPWQEQAGNARIVDSAVEIEWNTEAVYTLLGINEADVSVSVEYDLADVASERSIGILARHTGPGDSNAYMARVLVNGESIAAQIWKNVGGSYSPLRSLNVGTMEEMAAGTLRFDVVGSSLQLFVNDVLVASTIDHSIAGPGSVGVRQTGGRVDDFAATIGVPPLTTNAVLPFEDDFERADSSLLGPEWTERAGDVGIADGGMVLIAQETSIATVNGPLESDVIVEADIDLTLFGLEGNVGLLARHTGVGDDNAYMARLYQNGAGLYFVQVWRHAGTDWEFLGHEQVASGAGRLRFEVIGTSLKAFFDDTLVVDLTDSLITGPGLIGLRHSGGLVSGFRAALPN